MGNLLKDNKELMEEWDWENNKNLDPSKLIVGSGKKAWWICRICGYKWQTQIYVRKKHGCPFCGHKKVGNLNARIKNNNNSLISRFPDVIKVWNYEKNKYLKPEDFLYQSNKKVWWKCSECGKEWQSSISSKPHTIICGECAHKKTKRVYVKEGVNDLATTNPELLKEWNYKKNNITPKQIAPKSAKKVWWICEKGHEWYSSPLSRLKHSKLSSCPYCATKNRKVIKGYNDLETTHPQLAKEWNYEKNGEKLPSDITSGSNSRYWWKCSNGHTWQASPNNRLRGNGCPYCANQKLLVGYNDLETTHPQLAKEWDYDKNNLLTPKDVIAGSAKKVWWKCENGHDYKTSIVNRKKGDGCPYCANKKIIKGYNDLATVNPLLAKEWNYEKNNPLTPQDVIAGSTKKVWWKCSQGHEWQAAIVSRNKNHFCPICDRSKHTSISEKAIVYYLEKSNIKVKENFKINKREVDVFIPALGVAIEYDGQYFHKNINNDISKSKMLKENNIKLIRIREPELPHLNNGDIEIYIDELTSNYSYLNKPIKELFIKLSLYPIDIDVDRDLNEIYNIFQISVKKNNLLDNYPLLVKEWDYEKNSITPDKVTKGTHLKVWWKCSSCGYNWEAPIYSRCNGTGCPECAKKIVGESKKKKVDQYDKTGNYIKTFSSIADAEKETGAKNIFYVCSGKRKSSGGYIWKYKE